MNVQPITLATANQVVKLWHRHSTPVVGHRFSLGLFDELGPLLGVAIVGRPVSRVLDDGSTRNACSMLYGAACRAARAAGFRRVVTYTLASETGASVRAAGFRLDGVTRGRQWSTPTRVRDQRSTTPNRHRWVRDL